MVAGDDAFRVVKKSVADFESVQRSMQRASEREVKKTLRRIVTQETKPTRRVIKETARDELPKRGGLNKWAAVMPRAVTDFRPGRSSVKIQHRKSGHDMKALNRGRLRHPVYGNKKNWVMQSITPGFFERGIAKDEGDLKRRVMTAIDDMFSAIYKEGDG